MSLACMLFIMSGFSQTKPEESGSNPSQKQNFIVRPSKSDTTKKGTNPFQNEGMTDPNKAAAQELFKTGSRKESEGDYQGAIDDFTKSIEKYPNTNTYLKRCFCYMALENYAKALEDATEAINLSPKNVNAYYMQGQCYYELPDAGIRRTYHEV